MADPVT